MTREDLIQMAEKAWCSGEEAALLEHDMGVSNVYLDDLVQFARLVAEAEREECAKKCEEWAKDISLYKPRFWDLKLKLVIVGHKAAAKFIANAIRARGAE